MLSTIVLGIEQWEYLTMPRQRKAEDETAEQAEQRRLLEKVANTANRSDKVSWNRKLDNMIKLVTAVNRIQDKIQELEIEKDPYIQEIADLRKVMVNECIHPFDQLVHTDEHTHCKFCNANIVVVNGD